MLQTDTVVIDVRTILTMLSIIIGVIGMIIAWVSESRARRRETAMDAVANRLLPLYSLVIETIARLNLFLMTSSKIDYESLRVEPQKYYDRAGDAFVYITESSSRQLVIDIIQVLEAIDLVRTRANRQQITNLVIGALPLVSLLKTKIENYLDSYSESLQVNIPEESMTSSSSVLSAQRILSEAIALTEEKEQ